MLTGEEIDHLARLARLHLTEDERAVLTGQINEILGYVEKLKELEVDGIEPTAHVVPLKNIARQDQSRPSPDREEMLANAPERVNGYFKVPKILEG